MDYSMLRVQVVSQLIVVILFSVCLSAVSWGEEESQSILEVHDQLSTLESFLESISSWVSGKKDERTVLSEKLKANELEIQKVVLEKRSLQKKHAIEKKNLQKITTAYEKLLEEQEAVQENLLLFARAFHQLQVSDFMKAFLNAEDMDKTQRMLVYHAYMKSKQFELLESLEVQAKKVKQLKNKVMASEVELKRHLKALEKQEGKLKKLSKSRASVLSKMQKNINEKEEQKEEFVEQKKSLTSLLKRLESVQVEKDVQFKKPVRRKFSWPTEMTGGVAHAFGDKKSRSLLKWEGMLINARQGQQVLASYPGRVVFADWIRGLGLIIILDHGYNMMTLYGHNQALLHEVGDKVGQNEVIALVASQGIGNEQGLYFEMRKKGNPIDPKPWLNAR